MRYSHLRLGEIFFFVILSKKYIINVNCCENFEYLVLNQTISPI